MKKLEQYSQLQPFIQKDIDDSVEELDTKLTEQFGVVKVPIHTHNGSDSVQVPFANLLQRPFYIYWTIPGIQAQTAGNYSVFFISPVFMSIIAISEVHTTAGTDGGVVTLNIQKLTGTTAPGSGTNLLSTDLSLKTTANTVQNGNLIINVPNTSTAQMGVGDRLSLKLTGTPTSLTNVTILVTGTY